MILTIKVWTEDENEANKLAKELRGRGLAVQGPMYTNGYGAPRNYAGMGVEEDRNYPAPTEGEIDGD